MIRSYWRAIKLVTGCACCRGCATAKGSLDFWRLGSGVMASQETPSREPHLLIETWHLVWHLENRLQLRQKIYEICPQHESPWFRDRTHGIEVCFTVGVWVRRSLRASNTQATSIAIECHSILNSPRGHRGIIVVSQSKMILALQASYTDPSNSNESQDVKLVATMSKSSRTNRVKRYFRHHRMIVENAPIRM